MTNDLDLNLDNDKDELDGANEAVDQSVANEGVRLSSDDGNSYEKIAGPEDFDPDVVLSEEEQEAREAAAEESEDDAKWYVIHTYSGYENKVKMTLEQIVENRDIQDLIQEVSVPMEEVVEIKDGKKKTSMKKLYPGYVLVKMVLTDEVWYIVRNTRGVTGFVGPNSRPVPLTEEELAIMGMTTEWDPIVDYNVGDSVKVISGPLDGFIGTVESINTEKKKVKVMVSMFGRETPVDLEFTQVISLQTM